MGQRTQIERGEAFRALHQRDGAFIIPNPWDVGSARILSHLGFEALATTSGGYAFSVGQPDYAVGREAMIVHVSVLAAATDLPLSADLENGFGDAPEATAETIRLAAAAGAVGGSIEDATGRAEDPIYELALAAERVRAAAEVAHAQSFVFTLTARAENYLHGRSDLKNTIKRLQAYQEAGADVLYAPGITSKEEIATLVRAEPGRSLGYGSQKGKRRQRSCPRGPGCVGARRARNARTWNFCFCGRGACGSRYCRYVPVDRVRLCERSKPSLAIMLR
jgi:2-methylisocitrate lyase-like PEP mutase family enzyme